MKKAILISYYDSWYTDRLEYINIFLNSNEFDTTFLFGNFNHSAKKHVEQFTDIENVEYINTISYQKNVSVSRLYSHIDFANKIKKCIKKKQPDLVYCILPPNCLVKVLTSLKSKMGFDLIFDVIDLWPESLPGVKMNFLPFQYWRNLRDKNIDKADCVALECGLYAETLKNIVPAEKMKIFHLTRKPFEFSVSNDNICCDGVLRLAYLGSINSLIDIDLIAKFIKNLLEIMQVEVRIVGKGEKEAEFEQTLKNTGAVVKNYGAVYDEFEKKKIFEDCHFGLNVYKKTNTIGLTIKSVEYMQYGLPIINTIIGDTQELISRYGIGVMLNQDGTTDYDEVKCIYNNICEYREKVLMVFEKEFSSQSITERLSFLNQIVKERENES